jgi:hypothetical protein
MSGATISDCGTYRYRLWRTWSDAPPVLFVMLNPSTADATANDPTIRKCIAFAKRWGHGGIEVGNLFALRSTDPKALRRHPDPVGPDNDQSLRIMARLCGMVICAWGNGGTLNGRGRNVAAMLAEEGRAPLCFNITKAGQPEHPLYRPYTNVMQPYAVAP